MRNYSATIKRRKRGKRTEYIARLQYYDRNGQRREVCRSADNSGDAKERLEELKDKYVTGGEALLDARNLTFSALADHCKKTRYCEAVYDDKGRKLFGVRNPKKFESIINKLVNEFGHLKLSQITVTDLQNYRKTRLTTKTKEAPSPT